MSSHELLVDALQGCFYEDDECIQEPFIVELTRQKADGYLLFLKPNSDSRLRRMEEYLAS